MVNEYAVTLNKVFKSKVQFISYISVTYPIICVVSSFGPIWFRLYQKRKGICCDFELLVFHLLIKQHCLGCSQSQWWWTLVLNSKTWSRSITIVANHGQYVRSSTIWPWLRWEFEYLSSLTYLLDRIVQNIVRDALWCDLLLSKSSLRNIL